jgi:hypothetical protein
MALTLGDFYASWLVSLSAPFTSFLQATKHFQTYFYFSRRKTDSL